MRKLIAGAAAIALAAGMANAQPNKGEGKGNATAKVERGGEKDQAKGRDSRGGNAERGGPKMKADPAPQMAQAANKDRKADRSSNGNRGNGSNSSNGNGEFDRAAQMKIERGNNGGKDARDAAGAERRTVERQVERDFRRAADSRDGRDRGEYRERDWRRAFYRGDDARGLVDGCPPGLAKKYDGCMRPGQAMRQGDRFDGYAYRPSYFGYDNLGSGRYFYDDGFLMRYEGDRISGYIPLLGGALAVGNPWPDYYQDVRVPDYYQNYYNLGQAGSYRYADDVFYRVDPQTDAITSIVALLTGDQFTVGQPMPAGYDIYNVPYPYRDRYYDTPESQYRYSDGYVYQIDPTTRLIEAAIELLG